MGVNSCTFSGNLGKDIEVKILQNEKATYIAESSLAIKNWRPAGQGPTLWIGIKIIGRLAEQKFVCDLKKGDRVTVSGRLDVDEWADKNTGEKKQKIYIFVSEIEAPKKEGLTESQSTGHVQAPVQDSISPLSF